MKKNIHYYIDWAIYVFSLMCVWGVYIYTLFDLGFFDYDSVKNYQILGEIYHNEWQNLFHHASPVFFCVYEIFFFFSQQPIFLIFLSTGLQVLGIWYWSNLLRKKDLLLLFWLSLSFFVVSSSRYFSIEPLGLLLCGIVLSNFKNFIDFLTKHLSDTKSQFLPIDNTAFNQELVRKVLFIGFWCALLLLTNYKAVVTLFWIALFFIFQKAYRHILFSLFWKILLYFSIGFGLPIVGLMLVGSFLGLHFLQYPATLWGIVNLAGGVLGANTWDFFYYFNYFFYFENPLLLIIVGVGLWHRKHYFKKPFDTLLLWIVLGTWIVMTFLPKAPRGLVFIYPMLYYLAYIVVLDWITRIREKFQRITIKVILLYVPVVYAFVRIYTDIYAYTPTQYPLFAKILEEKKAKVVYSTLGMGIYPFLGATKFQRLRKASDTVKFGEYTGKKYLLYDAYAHISGHQDLRLDSLLGKKPYTVLRSSWEPSLLNPMLHLELSEYNGLDFKESLKKRKELIAQGKHLILVEFP